MLVHVILHDDVSCYRPRCVFHLMGRVIAALKLLATVKRTVLFACAIHLAKKTRTHLYTDVVCRLSHRQTREFSRIA
jgi:hypothetical protein